MFTQNPKLVEELETAVDELRPQVARQIEQLRQLSDAQDAEMVEMRKLYRDRMQRLADLNNTVKFFMIDPLLIVCNYTARARASVDLQRSTLT